MLFSANDVKLFWNAFKIYSEMYKGFKQDKKSKMYKGFKQEKKSKKF